MKPQLNFSKEIDSLRSLRQFSLKNYNFLSKLKVTKQPRANGPENLPHQKTAFTKFKQISSSMKAVKHLDLSSFRPQNFKASQLKLFLKKFYKIQRFSNPWTDKKKRGLYFALLFLQNRSYLKDLYLKASFKDLTKRLLSWISLSKIKTLHFTQIFSDKDKPQMLKPLLDSCPPTVENLSLFGRWKAAIQEESLNLQLAPSLKDLQKLELGVPLVVGDFQDVIKSVPEPLKLKSLQFHIIQEQMEAENFGNFQELLKRCANLEELGMKTGMFTRINFYSGAANMKLKKLNLQIQQIYDQDKNLLKLEELIQQQRNTLESFRLKLGVPRIESSSSFNKLFGNIKLLKNLKKLDLRLVPFVNRRVILPSYEPLAEIVQTLDDLEEINFEEVQVDFQNDKEEAFEDFCRILSQKHSRTLRCLKLCLKDSQHSKILTQTLKRLPKLEDLTLRDFAIEKNLNFYQELEDLVCSKNRGLNSVIILEDCQYYKNEEERQDFGKMVQKILRQPSMETFHYFVSE